MLVPEKTSGPSCVTSRPSDSVRMIASLKSGRLKTPNEGSKPEFHLRWIRENRSDATIILNSTCKQLDAAIHRTVITVLSHTGHRLVDGRTPGPGLPAHG